MSSVHLSDPAIAAILEAAPDALLCVTAGGRIVLANSHAGRLFGYSPDELAGQPVELLVPDASRSQHEKYRAEYERDPASVRPMHVGVELAGRRRDGTVFPAEIALSNVRTDEGRVILAAVRDLTGRRAAEAERQRLRAEAEQHRLADQLHRVERLETLGQLAGGIAHDFNNLLGVISSYASFISEEVGKEPAAIDWAGVRADIGEVEHTARRAADLTRQLLAFARRRVIQPRVLDLNEVISGLLPLLGRTLGEHVALIPVLVPGLGPVLADPGQIEQVLVNLAVNARDAMPAGGRLTIETADTELPAGPAGSAGRLPAGRYVSIQVSDTGAGMPQEVIDRAFEPFFTTKPEGKGTGLGLATVYGIVTQAGGDVRIYSRPGLGTTVTILLPRSGVPAAAPVARLAAPADGQGETVLLVEDESALREVTRRMLARHGYQVLTAPSAPAAVDLAASHPGPIDLLLTDVVMPDLQGPEVAARVQAGRPGLRVLYMSGFAPGFLGAEGALPPGVRLIEKPFAENTLLAALCEVLSRES
jgi:PAS domain S-box-containing protein